MYIEALARLWLKHFFSVMKAQFALKRNKDLIKFEKKTYYLFLINGIRWPLFYYLHHNLQSLLIIFLCIGHNSQNTGHMIQITWYELYNHFCYFLVWKKDVLSRKNVWKQPNNDFDQLSSVHAPKRLLKYTTLGKNCGTRSSGWESLFKKKILDYLAWF